ncbi:MAG: hypothetical protein KKF48_02390 [Nanoarchaeota archaeon]|nr:hypothetical protein [Nanoarchaeota archaeon]MBU1027869.1 hypothetical protein [Nanoarchaeota archaeon]
MSGFTLLLIILGSLVLIIGLIKFLTRGKGESGSSNGKGESGSSNNLWDKVKDACCAFMEKK